MSFPIKDLAKIKNVGNKNYVIKRWEYNDTFNDAYKDMHRIYELMKYNINNNKVFENISFIIGLSTTGRKNKQQAIIREKILTGGRPKYKIVGVKKLPHLHIACFGENCPTFVKTITDKLNKKAFKTYDEFLNRKTKSKRLFTYDKLVGENNGMYYIPYIYNQADTVMTYGELEFDKMKDDFFIVENNTDF